MSLLRTKGLQIGQDGTATNNFTLYQPGVPDGTLRIGSGNSGSVTDAITLSSNGSVDLNNNTLHFNTAQSQYINPAHISDGNMLVHGGSGLFINLNNSNNDISIYTNNTQRLKVNVNGQITTPAQPAFMAVRTTSQSTTPFVVTGYTSITNIGNNFNASTGIFTAPVAGLYQFTFACIGAGSFNHSNDIYGYLNGARNQASLAIRPNSNTNSYASMGSNTVLVSLSANDTFGIYVENGTSLYGDTNAWVRFSGRLLG